MTDFDHITLEPHKRDALIDELVAYADTDLLCYFAEEEALLRVQRNCWQPILSALESEWNVKIKRTQGIMPITQSPDIRQYCQEFLSHYDHGALIAIAQLITQLGSIFITLALMNQHITLDQAIEASQIDETYQQQQWGEDEEKSSELHQRAEKIRNAHTYLLTLGAAT